MKARGMSTEQRRQGIVQGVSPAFACCVCTAALSELRRNHRYPVRLGTCFGEFPPLLFHNPQHNVEPGLVQSVMLDVLRLRLALPQDEGRNRLSREIRAADRSERLEARGRRIKEAADAAEERIAVEKLSAVKNRPRKEKARERERDSKRRKTVRALVEQSGLGVDDFWRETVQSASAGNPARWFDRWGRSSFTSPSDLQSFLA